VYNGGVTPTERKCPICQGIVKPNRRGGDPDATLALHIDIHNGKEKKMQTVDTRQDVL
jgi:hypothetical protein